MPDIVSTQEMLTVITKEVGIGDWLHSYYVCDNTSLHALVLSRVMIAGFFRQLTDSTVLKFNKPFFRPYCMPVTINWQ